MTLNFYKKYDYDPNTTKEIINGESHTIPSSSPYIIYLKHLPREENPSTVAIAGFTETTSATPNAEEFKVSYGNLGLGRIKFNSADAGKTIEVDYNACGSVIWAENYSDGREGFNKIQDNLKTHFNNSDIHIKKSQSDALDATNTLSSTNRVASIEDIADAMAGSAKPAVQTLTDLSNLSDNNDKDTRLVENENKVYRYDDNATTGDLKPDSSDGTGVGAGNGWWIVISAATQTHNNLSGLQGGKSSEYYHLTQAEYDNLHDRYTDSEAISAVANDDAYVKNIGDSMSGSLTIDNGGGALKLKPGTDDHVYIDFHSDSENKETRSGWMGYGSAGSNVLSINNSTEGNIRLAGGNVNIEEKLGIGTTSPSENLDVVGNIAVTGTVNGVDVSVLDNNFSTHMSADNPHEITKADIGLENVEDITLSTVTWSDLGINKTDISKSDVGLENVPNTDIAYSSTIPADAFTSAEVTNLRAGKLDNGTTPWTSKLPLSGGTLTGSLQIDTIDTALEIGKDGVDGDRELKMWAENGYEAKLVTFETSTHGMGLRYNANDNILYVDRYPNTTTPTSSVEFHRDSSKVNFTADTLTHKGKDIATEDWVSSNFNDYSLPTASSTTLGGVKVGSRLSISSGTLSADSQTDNNFTTTLKDKLNGIESGANNFTSDDLVISPRKEQDSPPSEYPNGLYAMDSESDSPYNWTYDAGIVWGIKPRHSNYRHLQFIANSNGSELKMRMKNASENDWQDWRALATQSWVSSNFNNYSLSAASSTTLGGIKVGSRLSITDGILSADSQTDNNFTTTLKNKLDGIESNANNYSLEEHGNDKHSATYATISELFSGSYDDLTDIPSTFTPSSHNHSADDITSGTISESRLPSSALIEDTTYSAGSGLSLDGTEFSLSGDSFDSSGNYASLRARGTTKEDVGLSDVDNVKQAPHSHVGSTGNAHGEVTTSTNGFMSSDDKSKLNGIESNANNYTLEEHGNDKHSENYLTQDDIQIDGIPIVSVEPPENPGDKQVWIPLEDGVECGTTSKSIDGFGIYTGHTDEVQALTNDDKYVYSGGTDGEVHQIDKLDGSQGWVYTGHTDEVQALTNDDKYVYSGGTDGEVHQIDKLDGSQGWVYTGHTDEVQALTNDDKYVYSSGTDGEVHQIDKLYGFKTWSYTGHTDEVQALTNDDKYVYSGGVDEEVHQINKFDGSQGWVYTGSMHHISCLTSDENSVYAGTSGHVREIDKTSGSEGWLSLAGGYLGDFIILSLTNDENFVYIGTISGIVYRIDKAFGNPVEGDFNSEHTDRVYALTNDENFVYSGSADNEVHQINKSDITILDTSILIDYKCFSKQYQNTIWDEEQQAWLNTDEVKI